MTALVWLLAVVVAVLALLVVGLLRSHATILRALHDAGISLDPDAPSSGSGSGSGSDAPAIRTRPGVPGPGEVTGQRGSDIVGTTPQGATRSVSVTGGTTTLLAFLTTGCATCAGFWQSFRNGVDLPDGVRLVVVTKSEDRESPAEVAALAAPDVLTIQSSQAWNDYRIPMAPYFALVEGDRGVVIGEGAAASWDRVHELLTRALADTGMATDTGVPTVRRRDVFRGRTGRARKDRVDQALLDAGITPGDPRLYHDGGADR